MSEAGLQSEIDELEFEINHPRRWYEVEERQEDESVQIKTAVLICLARMSADREAVRI